MKNNSLKIVAAIDSFKGSLTSKEAAAAVRAGILRAYPDACVVCAAVADGGDGTAEALCDTFAEKIVCGPLGKPVKARYGFRGKTAVIEMALASGLALLKNGERDIMRASTFGTGELILDALEHGARDFIIGIGGSATNDGGVGMMSALGVRFTDENGRELPPGGGALSKLARIDVSGMDGRIAQSRFRAACDVRNPLCGENGASAVYGPQKGASAADVKVLDDNLRHYGKFLKEITGRDIAELPGSGAAGGLGAALTAFLGCELTPGVELVLDAAELDKMCQDCDMVITGEGRTDFQTAFGKAPIGVATVAKRYNKPCFVISGSLGKGYEEVYAHGIDAAYSIITRPMTLEDAVKNADKLVSEAAERLVRTFTAARK